MSELRNPHDLFFRETFSRLDVAQDFLVNYLPAQVTKILDLSTLELQKDSFIDPELQEHFSDLLYKVRLRDGSEANVYFLLEHKSYPDKAVAFQLLRYMVRLWERTQREKSKTLPPIIPIVVYHGREKWRVSENFEALFEGSEVLRPYWPKFQYELQDFSKYSVVDIMGETLLRVVIMLLVGVYDPNLPERLVDIFRVLAESANDKRVLEYLEIVLRYISAAAQEITPEQIHIALNEAFENDGGSIMGGFVEKWIEKGKEEGLQEGRQEGRQQERRNSILDLLMLRFDVAPVYIANRLEEITDLEMLRQVNHKAATAESLAVFEQYLEKIYGST